MNASDSNSPFNDSSYSRERLELETRVLAAALRQSLEIGDTEGSSLAHEQIFLLLKASQEMVIDEPISLPREIHIEKGRQLPDIDWGAAEPEPAEASEVEHGHVEPAADNNFAPPADVEYEDSVVEGLSGEEESPAEETLVEVDQPLEAEQAPYDHSVEEQSAEEHPAPEATGEEPVAEEKYKGEDYYAELKVTDLADFASIHLAFWRMLRVLLRQEIGLIGPNRLPHLRAIQRLWIAHDILCDPVTRADYDFRRMGLRGDDIEDEMARAGKGSRGPRTQLRIGELLQCAGLLEQTELDIAADMHKAMPEMMFGTFLVKQGFIEEADLDCVLVGQQLLKTGDITVVQFQTVMIERDATGLDIGEMLLAKGYVTEFLLERAYRNQSEDTLVKVPIVVAPGHVTTIEAKPHHEPVQDAAPAPVEAVEIVAEEKPATAPEEPPKPRETPPPGRRTLGSLVPPSVTRQNMAAQPPVSSLVDDLGPLISEPESVPVPEPAQVVEQPEIAAATTDDTVNSAPEANFNSALASNSVPAETTISIGNAAPAWKDQLDWSSPEEDPEPAIEPEPVLEPEPEPILEPEYAQSLETSELQAPDVVAEENLADSVRAIAQIWAEEPDPIRSWARPPAEPVSAPEPEPALEVEPESEPEPESESELESESEPELQPTAEQVFEEIPQAVLDIGDDIVSEIETSSQLPSLGTLEAQAGGKKKDRSEQPKRGTGDWQIMSVPGSALTSLFLDDEPEAPPEPSNVFINEDQYQTGPRKVHVLEAEAKSHPQPQEKDESQVQTIPPASNLPDPAADLQQKDGSKSSGPGVSNSSGNNASDNNPPDNESRRAKRRRTRS